MHTAKHYIGKGLSLLLLTVMLQTYLCTALCSAGAYSCCRTMKSDHACCQKSAHHTDNPKDNCQDEHNAFFATIGQFFSHDQISLDHLYWHVTALAALPDWSYSLTATHYPSSFAGFRSPPPETDIRLLVQNFRI